MVNVLKLGRRAFLVGSMAITGGVAFGVYSASQDFENPNMADLDDESASFNPWVVVTKDKVQLIAPHADKGQGIFSTQAALICEELDIDLDQVEISFGKPDKAYYNRALSGAMVPTPMWDSSTGSEFARTVAGGVIKLLMPMMGTGGSSAVPDSYQKLREAGAAARETLKRAASKVSGEPVSLLKTANGAVQLPDGRELKYTELAVAAAKMSVPSSVALKEPKDWRLLGKKMGRVDIPAKSTGTLTYGIDHKMPDMVHAAVRVNPRQYGKMKSYDASEARQMRGVKGVFEVTRGVAVVADNSWRAFKAVEAIDCEWGEAPYPAEQEEHWNVLSKAFVEEKLNAEARVVGDVAAAEGESVSAEYKSPYVAHAPLEPLSVTILVKDGRADIWTGHQFQMVVEQFVAEIAGIDIKNVHLHNMFIGGSFGHRLEFDYVRQCAEIAVQMPGVPVKLTYTREEDFAHDFPRHITMGRGSGKVADGKVVSLDLQIAAQSVMGSQLSRMGMSVPGPDAQLHEGAWDNPYLNLPNLRVRSYRETSLAPVSSWRSVGAAPNGFMYDTFLDELIFAAGADPLEERIRLMGHAVSVKVLEAVGEMSSWGGSLAENQGRGVAYVFSFGVPVAAVVEVTNTEYGIRIDKAFMAADVGKVLDPMNLTNLAEGGMVFGLGHAMNCEITYSDGMAEQTNFHTHEGMRLYQCPKIEFRALENADKIRGFGEPPVPPMAPALGNAIFAATGKRLREMPFNKFVDFV